MNKHAPEGTDPDHDGEPEWKLKARVNGDTRATTVVIGLGANVGDRHAAFDAALASLRAQPAVRVIACSPRYETAPLLLPGAAPQDRYLNGAVRVTTALEPHALLDVCLAIESALGRVRRERWGPRTIDLDLLFALDADGAPIRVATERLTLPHPGLVDREFALRPLLDVAPELAGHFEGAPRS
jgi:2-amino-4-hydroxy-6-hydroxymethyldihydropteridine diphosphokinase